MQANCNISAANCFCVYVCSFSTLLNRLLADYDKEQPPVPGMLGLILHIHCVSEMTHVATLIFATLIKILRRNIPYIVSHDKPCCDGEKPSQQDS